MHCIICSSDGGRKGHSELSISELKTVVDDAKTIGLKTVILSGGEPLECRHTLNFIRYLKENDIEVHLYSCGNLESKRNIIPLSKSLLDQLKKLAIDKLIFSIHGPDQTIHEAITTKAGSFTNLITSIRRAKECYLPVELHFVPVIQNYKSLPKVVKLATDLSISRISILRFVPQGRGSINRERLEIANEEVFILKKILQTISSTPLIEVRLGTPFNCLSIDTPTPCTAGINKATIRPDGLVFPCVSMKKIGLIRDPEDIGESNIIKIWNHSESFDIIRRLHKKTLKSCDSCQNTNCMSRCITQNYINSISDSNKDEYCLTINQRHNSISKIYNGVKSGGGVSFES
jgi:MoaA/NifB/PqqE/SkfB family radical SAM enzyme